MRGKLARFNFAVDMCAGYTTAMLEPLKHRSGPAVEGPVVVVVMDGVGLGRRDEGDAVHLARTPTLDWLDTVALRTSLLAHGPHVGMPGHKDMGNSEVGHNALGAGRIYDQGAKLVDNAITSGSLFDVDNPESAQWNAMVDHVRSHGSTLHLIGLLSDGNVHSHIDHVEAIATEAARRGVARLRLHCLLDGRDVAPQSALEYVDRITAHFRSISDVDYQIASGGGRMLVTMDRYEADWEIVERGWRAHVLGEAPGFESARLAIEAARAAEPNLNDQFLPPFVVWDDDGRPVGTIEDGDAVLLFNFRGDRAIELSRAFEEEPFTKFDRHRSPDVLFAGMMQYDGDRGIPGNFLVPPPSIRGTMGERLARAGAKQLAVSETQKFGHVTYFWNGNRTDPFDEATERYIQIPSDRVVFDERPWMKAAEITDAAIDALRAEPDIQFVRINYPNGDMVGHTGNLEASIIAVEATDLCLARLLAFIGEQRGAAIVTADHGNADQMFAIGKDGEFVVDDDGVPVPMTAHTLNPVPLWIWTPSLQQNLELAPMQVRRLSNVAATALYLMGYDPPSDMDDPLIRPT